jgi:hypothetical protein
MLTAEIRRLRLANELGGKASAMRLACLMQ